MFSRYHFIFHDKGKPRVSVGRKVMGPFLNGSPDRRTVEVKK